MSNNEIVPGFDDEKDDSLKIRLQKIADTEGCLVLYLTGYIDTYNSNYFQKRVNKAIEGGFIKLIFHCSGLNYVSSTGIGSFTAFLKQVKPRGGDLVLLEIQPKVYFLVYLCSSAFIRGQLFSRARIRILAQIDRCGSRRSRRRARW